MKRITCILFCFLLLQFANAQNMVPNGNFESYSICPTSGSQINRCIGWEEYTPSSDYFNVCCVDSIAGVPVVGVPDNFWGSQLAASGNGYAGIGTSVFANSFKESITSPITPLIIGGKYEVSMSVSLADNANYATNSLGVHFFDNGQTTGSNITLSNITPTVSYSSYGAISNKNNWVRLTSVFIADSAYDNIIIASFGQASSYTVVNAGGNFNFAYYYIDSIVVQIAYGIQNLYNDSTICIGDTFQVPYSLTTHASLTSTNIFSVQLSNSSGSFASGTTIIGTRTATTAGSISCVVPTSITPGANYRIRILSSSTVDSSAPNTKNIAIGKYPAALTACADSVKCAGNTIHLTSGSTTTGVNYTWTGPNSFTSTSQNPAIHNSTTAMTGNYIVTGSIYACQSRDTTVVTINPTPIPVIASASTPICVPDTLFLNSTNNSTGVTWAWTGPGSYTASTQNPVRVSSTPSMSGDYIVTATNSFNCTAKDTVTVLVKPLPASVAATANTICEGGTLFLTGNSTSSGVTWSWAGPNGFTSTLQNPNIPLATTAASGAYILTASLNGCTDKDTAFGTVFPIPATPVPSANTPVCTGQDLKLTATNVAGAAYSWTSTTGYSSALQNPILPTATTAMAGKYYVQATANGCSSGIDSVTVTVNPAPVINMYPSPDDSICQGATLTFVSNQSNAGTVFERKWYRNNTLIATATGANYSTTTAADNDVYYVTLTGGNCAEPFTDTSNQILIRVFPWLAPKVSITANPTGTVASGTMINFTATPTNGGTTPAYQWTRNGANIVGALSNVWGAPTLSNNDEICVNMTSSYLCPNPKTVKSNCIKVSIETTGIKGTWIGKQPSIYPNPVKDLLIIEGIQTGTTIQLTDVAGRTLIRKTAISNNETLNMQNIIPGNYILLLDDNKGNIIRVKIAKD